MDARSVLLYFTFEVHVTFIFKYIVQVDCQFRGRMWLTSKRNPLCDAHLKFESCIGTRYSNLVLPSSRIILCTKKNNDVELTCRHVVTFHQNAMSFEDNGGANYVILFTLLFRKTRKWWAGNAYAKMLSTIGIAGTRNLNITSCTVCECGPQNDPDFSSKVNCWTAIKMIFRRKG